MDNFFDRLIDAADVSLKTLTGSYRDAARPMPGGSVTDNVASADQAHLVGLMRVNHTGEVCAQGLYAGQSLFARDRQTLIQMQHSAEEEIDHLVWCKTVLDEHAGRTSLGNPLFYAGSFALGAAAAIVNDKTSLAFVHATEENVEAHLADHLNQLPAGADRTQAVLTQMQQDEIEHGQLALDKGGKALPKPIRSGMKQVAKIMTTLAYRI